MANNGFLINFFDHEACIKALFFLFGIKYDIKFKDHLDNTQNPHLAINSFFQERKLNILFSEIFVKVKHLTTLIDDGKSLNKFGLINLISTLKLDTPMKIFLNENGIKVFPHENYVVYEIDGEAILYDEKYLIEMNNQIGWGPRLLTRFKYHKGELEGYLAGSDFKLINESRYLICPEIIQDIEDFTIYLGCHKKLKNLWRGKRNFKKAMITMDIPIDWVKIDFEGNDSNYMTKEEKFLIFFAANYISNFDKTYAQITKRIVGSEYFSIEFI